MDASPDRFVSLRGGLITPIEPYLLLLRLEREGFTFRLAPDGMPEIAPFDRLTAEDRAVLRRWRHHVELLLRYTPDDSHLFVTEASSPAVPTTTRRAS